MSQARWWILTIPRADWSVPASLPDGVTYLRGQAETGESGYEHWQLVVNFPRAVRLAACKAKFTDTTHAEPTRSEAALEYVWKDETAVPDTRFELGRLPLKRNSSTDWDAVWVSAKSGKLGEIPSDIRIRCYSTLKRIYKDNTRAPFRDGIKVKVFWGVTGSGKSHRAFAEAGAEETEFFVKGSTTKWWDSYKGESRVIIDEFRGQIGIEHMLKWFDKYPCYVEEKGGQLPLMATEFWICSNLHPRAWYPMMDEQTLNALLRRLEITEFIFQYRG